MTGFVPYCGLAPVPGSLDWKLDPFLIGSLFALAAANLAFARLRAAATMDLVAGLFGWLVLSLAFISPLCHLSVALFSARATQHMVITLVAAPLIARAMLPAFASEAMAGVQFFRVDQRACLRGNLLDLA